MKRFKRMNLLFQSILRFIIYGRADKISRDINRIIVVPSGKLGDVVCCTPVFIAIRKNLPQVHIIAAGNSKFLKNILNYSGLVDEYVDMENDTINADVAVVTGPSFEPTSLLYLAGVPLVVAPKVEGGFSPSETRPYKILQHFIKTFPYRMGEYAPRERLMALEPLGIFYDDTTKHLGFSEAAGEKIKQFFIDNGIAVERDFVVGVSPSAGNKIKEWPEERFAEVVDHLFEKYKAKIFIVGGPGDKDKLKKTISYLKPNTEFIQASDFNLDELKAFLSKLKLFISVDTGPIYIAEAFDVPTINIVGPVDERVQPPQGPKHINVVPERTKAELFILNARAYNEKEALRQVNSITVDLVKNAVDSMMKM